MSSSVDTAKRRILPRRALPNGRAVVGALLVTVAMVGTFTFAERGTAEPSSEYLVVVADIEPGDTIELDDVVFEAMELSPTAAANALQSTAGLEGATALAHLRADTILDVRDLSGAAYVDGAAITAVHELTIPVPSDRAPTALRRGDRVTVLAYSGPEATLHTAIEDALVLRYEPDPTGIGSAGDARLTLALADAVDVARVARWSYQALTVVLTTRDLDDVYPTHVSPPTTTTVAAEIQLEAT